MDNAAEVTAVLPCPPIADGDGEVVTGRFISRQVQRTAAVTFQGGTVLEGTLTHPIWSVDRQDWIGLAELQTGEQVMGSAGPLAVVHVALRHRPVPVYDLEVHGEHVYQVTNAGILVHNRNYSKITNRAASVKDA